MNIDRSNYEVWFIDWLDGNLNSLRTKELHNFLDLNPDLKGEFNELRKIKLTAPESLFRFKENLKKSPEEISISQFEYLCAAYLENDLTEQQKTEIDEIVKQDKTKNRIFELINKTHLTPLNIQFKYKKKLLKSTPAQKIIRFSVVGLSAAAAIIFIIVNYLSVPQYLPEYGKKEAQVVISDSNLVKSAYENHLVRTEPEIKQTDVLKENVIQLGKNIIVKSPVMVAKMTEKDINDSLNELKTMTTHFNQIQIVRFSGLGQHTDNYNLALSTIVIKKPETDDGRSKIVKYIARTFREKLLKEKTPLDAPLKGYEIAEAGVSGINKLLGWEMALDKRNDENGELNSIYFSSKLLKFNTPVKKSEPSE